MANPRIPYRLSSSAPPLPPLDGKRILVHLVVNVEHWLLEQPMRTIITAVVDLLGRSAETCFTTGSAIHDWFTAANPPDRSMAVHDV